MKTRIRIGAVAAAIAAASVLASPAQSKGTLVFCSEGSPEGFQPQFFTTGTTFDAVSVPMFNRLVELFRRLPAETRDDVRTHLLELFEAVDPADPIVIHRAPA